MKIAICEDERVFFDRYSEHITEWAKEKGVFAEIFAYETAKQFLDDWNEREDYDIILLDIRIGDMSGMDLAKIIRRTNHDVPIVFATSSKEYAIPGYEVEAMQYLVKPIEKADLVACFDRVNQTDRIKKYFLFGDLDKTVRIPHEDVLYISMYSHTATMVTAASKYEFRKTISKILEELDDKLFVQCQKSYIVNIRHIHAISQTDATMSNGDKVSLSRNMAGKIYDMYVKYSTHKL